MPPGPETSPQEGTGVDWGAMRPTSAAPLWGPGRVPSLLGLQFPRCSNNKGVSKGPYVFSQVKTKLNQTPFSSL